MSAPARPAWLFAPANAARKAEGALASEADVVVLDLEDAVPAAEKEAARAMLAGLGRLARRGVLAVRVNAAGTASCLRDIEAAVAAGADAIMLPKAETAAEIGAVCWALDQLDVQREIELMPLVETARGVRDADRIAWGPRVRQLAFGTVDYALELNLDSAAGEEAVDHARHALVAGSRAAGLEPPIDGVSLAARDAAITARDAARARSQGFGGKLAIHPIQVAAIQGAFAEVADLGWARDVIAAFAAAEAAGSGAVLVRDRLVDRPVLLKARRVLEQATSAIA